MNPSRRQIVGALAVAPLVAGVMSSVGAAPAQARTRQPRNAPEYAVSLNLEEATGENYAQFIEQLRRRATRGATLTGHSNVFTTTPDARNDVFFAGLSSRADRTIGLAIRASDFYVLGWYNAQNDIYYYLRDEDYRYAAAGQNEASNLSGSYASLDPQGTVRTSRVLGHTAMTAAVETLSNPRSSQENRSRALLDLIQMVAEAARFTPISARIADPDYWTGQAPLRPTMNMISLENNWDGLSRFYDNLQAGTGDQSLTLRGFKKDLTTVAQVVALLAVYLAAGKPKRVTRALSTVSGEPAIDAIIQVPVNSSGGNWGEVWAFKGSQYVRLDSPGDPGNKGSSKIHVGPRSISAGWSSLEGTVFADDIDAIVPFPGNPQRFYLFKGGQYKRIEIDPNTLSDHSYGNPQSISAGWPVLRGTGFENGIDAAVGVPYLNDQVYLFKGSKYIRLKVDEGGTGDAIQSGPRELGEGFSSLANTNFIHRIDAAVKVSGTPGDIYLFHDDGYTRIRFDGGATLNDSVVLQPLDVGAGWRSLRGTAFTNYYPSP